MKEMKWKYRNETLDKQEVKMIYESINLDESEDQP